MPNLPKKPRSQKLEERAAAKDKKAAFYRQSNVNLANQADQLKSKKSNMVGNEAAWAEKTIPKLRKDSSKANIKSIAISEKAYNLKAKANKLKSKGK
jgi:hypothetical protein